MGAPHDIDPGQGRLKALLDQCLVQHFGLDDPGFHRFIEDGCTFREVAVGETLIRRGEPGEAVYFLLSGHLRAVVDGQTVGEIGRGSTVGELSLFTGRPRGADVVAVRDSIVAELPDALLRDAVARQPQLAFAITSEIISRFERERAASAPPPAPVTTTIMPITDGVDAARFACELAAQRERAGDRVQLIDAAFVRERYGQMSTPDTVLPRGDVSLAIGTMELDHDALIFVADSDDIRDHPAWAQTAIHHSDEVVLLADATADPARSHAERTLLAGTPGQRAALSLVLVHESDTRIPTGTPDWLAPRDLTRHIHVRKGHAADMRRAGRMLSGRAVGLVLAGGGARGLVHLGVLQGLYEAGIEFDMVGGTSAGGIMGTYAALDVPGDRLREGTEHIFTQIERGNITGDFNAVPYISLIKGERAHAAMQRSLEDHARPGIDMTDSWKTFFVIASDFTERREVVLKDGSFARNVVASASIPGVMPPTLIDGHLVYDGGSFNNFPVDVMRDMGAAVIIGSDLLSDTVRTHELVEAPGSVRALWDRISPGQQKYRVPSLSSTLLQATTVTSMARQRAARDQVDLLFQPDTRGLSLLSWNKYDQAYASGLACARSTLESADPELIARLTRPSANPPG